MSATCTDISAPAESFDLVEELAKAVLVANIESIIHPIAGKNAFLIDTVSTACIAGIKMRNLLSQIVAILRPADGSIDSMSEIFSLLNRIEAISKEVEYELVTKLTDALIIDKHMRSDFIENNAKAFAATNTAITTLMCLAEYRSQQELDILMVGLGILIVACVKAVVDIAVCCVRYQQGSKTATWEHYASYNMYLPVEGLVGLRNYITIRLNALNAYNHIYPATSAAWIYSWIGQETDRGFNGFATMLNFLWANGEVNLSVWYAAMAAQSLLPAK